MHEALLFEKLKDSSRAKPRDSKVRCGVCQRRCIIAENQAGYCKTRINEGGKLYTLIYGVVSSACVDPIEKKPVFHYKPGSLCFSVGTFGCNFRCDFCQNWDISYADMHQQNSQLTAQSSKAISPEKIIEMAKKQKCHGLAFTYNEPAIWLEYTIDCAKLAKKAGLYTVYVTNGFITDKGLDLIGPYLDVYRVDIKSMDNNFYQKLIAVPDMEGILEVLVRAKNKWKMHIEIVTNIVPTWNDSDENLKKLASWMVKNLGPKTPWHVTRFHPCAQLTDVPPTPLETLEKAVAIGKKAGLEFVYIGNVGGHEAENTRCPKCGKVVIERSGYNTNVIAVKNGRCGFCGEDSEIVQ